jgi:hypothetical protein
VLLLVLFSSAQVWEVFFPQVMPMWQHNVEVPVIAWPGTIALLPT